MRPWQKVRCLSPYDDGSVSERAMLGDRIVESTTSRSRWAVFGLVGILFFQAVLTLAWLQIDTRPPVWDRANHAERAFRCSEILASPAEDFLSRIASISGFYPPLVHCLVGLTYLFAPVSEFTHQAITFLFLVIAVVATYFVGSSLGGLSTGLVAAGLLIAAPLIQVESRAFMLDIPLMTFVTLSYLSILKSDGFTRRGACIAVGITTGLGLLTKWSLVIYTFPAFLASLYWGLKRQKNVRPLALAGVAAIVAAVIAGPWYLRNIVGLISSLGARAFRSGRWEGDPPVLSAGSAFYYLASLAPQVGLVAALLFLVGLAFLFTKRSPVRVGLALSWIAPWALFTLLRNKDLRYTLPLIPVVVLIAASGLLHLSHRARHLAVGAVVVASVWQVLASGFGILAVGSSQPFFRDLPLFLSDPPRSEHWPIQEILQVIAKDSGGRPVAVTIVPDYPEFSRSNFRYAATLSHLPYRFGRAWDESPIGYDYIVLKTGDQGPLFATRKARGIMELLSQSETEFHKVFPVLARFPLPTGEEATVLKREIQPVEASSEEIASRLRHALKEYIANYARNVEGFRVEITSDHEGLRRGRIARLAVYADRADVGDFQRKPAHIVLANVKVEFDGLIFNPHALMEEGRLELLSLGVVKIMSVSLTDDAIRAYLRSDPKLRGIEVFLEPNAVRLEIRRGWLHGLARLSIQSSHGLPDLDVLHTSLWGVPVPTSMVKALLGGVDLEGRLEELPVEIFVESVSIREGRLEIPANDQGRP